MEPHNPVGFDGIGEALARQAAENSAKAQMQIDEEDNTVLIIQGKIALEAIGDQILVLIDKFKSGTECRDCEETGIIKQCICEISGHTGLNRLGGDCKFCLGNPKSVHGKTCPTCKGNGQTIIIPESSKSLPTSGKIVSCGPKCVSRKLGERVIFGAHTGYFIPFKGNVRLRIMREDEPLCLVYAVDPKVAMSDFMVLEEPINNKGEL